MMPSNHDPLDVAELRRRSINWVPNGPEKDRDL
jgi:hypothetical protein